MMSMLGDIGDEYPQDDREESGTLAELIDEWHASAPGATARLARALHAVGPVLDGAAIYAGECQDDANMRVGWDASRAYREFPEPGDIPPEEELSARWGIPLSSAVLAPFAEGQS